ncbi:MAG: nitroreductase family deazaflavin-dependent oxidoreductase, partial [Thiohalocapsa sp.]
LFAMPAWLYRWHCGWLLGHRFLLLIHVGRRSGLRRRTVLEVVEYRSDVPEAVVVSAYGHNADWLRNIAASPSPEVIIGRQCFVASYRRLGEAEAAQVLRGYLQRNRLIAPLIRVVLSRFLGWEYDGSEAHSGLLAAQLPVLAFRPADRPLSRTAGEGGAHAAGVGG